MITITNFLTMKLWSRLERAKNQVLVNAFILKAICLRFISWNKHIDSKCQTLDTAENFFCKICFGNGRLLIHFLMVAYWFISWRLSSQLPALTYSTIGNTLKMHYYLFTCVYICVKSINSIQSNSASFLDAPLLIHFLMVALLTFDSYVLL